MALYSRHSSERRFKLTAVQTMEVATARVYNWDVQERRKDKEKGGGKDTADDDESKAAPNG